MKHAFALAVLLCVFFVFARQQIFTWPYYYDEADYMFAASLGWRANYSDDPSQPLSDFILVGLHNGPDLSQRAALSSQTRTGADVNFYRHWHGPMNCYWLLALAPFHLDEPATRSLSYIFPALTFLVIYLGSLWLLPASEGFLAAILSSAFYLWSYATTVTNEIAPHQLFVLFYISALILLLKWSITGEPWLWFGAVVLSAFAFCTLEVAFVLVLVLLVFGWLDPKAGDSRWIAKSIATFVATVLLLWPAAVLKLSFLKAYLFMAYLAIYRKSPWGHLTVLETWRSRFANSPAEWLLLGIAVILYFRFCDSATRRLLSPILLYACLMLIVLLRVATATPRYMLPFLPALELAAGLVFASFLNKWKPMLRGPATAVICSLLLWNTAAQIRTHPIRPAPQLAALVASLRNQQLSNKKLLVPQGDLPMIHYYVPGVVLSGYVNEQERSTMLARERFDAVLDGDKIAAPPTSLLSDER